MRTSFFVAELMALCALAGCGAEVAGAAATTAKLQAEQAEAAKAQQDQLKKNLGAVLEANAAAASAAANADR